MHAYNLDDLKISRGKEGVLDRQADGPVLLLAERTNLKEISDHLNCGQLGCPKIICCGHLLVDLQYRV